MDPLSPRQTQVVAWLAQVGHSSTTTIGAHLYGSQRPTHRARALTVLAALERRELVRATELSRGQGADREQWRWELTEAGRAVEATWRG